MYQTTFGKKQQISFNLEEEYYEFLGFLSKNDGTTIIVWENNDDQGAWGKEGRILFFSNEPAALRASLSQTAGVGRIVSRVNCNEFVQNIVTDHNFKLGENQDLSAIRNSIPTNYLHFFEIGLNL